MKHLVGKRVTWKRHSINYDILLKAPSLHAPQQPWTKPLFDPSPIHQAALHLQRMGLLEVVSQVG